MHTDDIASCTHRFSEKHWPLQMQVAKSAYDSEKSKSSISVENKTEWESIDPDDRVSVLSDCVGLLMCEIDRIEHASSSSKTIDDIMIGIYGKASVDKMKTESPETYNNLTSGMKKYASEKCKEQRRNVLNHLTKTPFFIKHRVEFPRSLVLQAPEPKL